MGLLGSVWACSRPILIQAASFSLPASWVASGLKLVWLGQQGLYNPPHFLSPPPLSPARQLPKVAAMGKTRLGDQAGSRS